MGDALVRVRGGDPHIQAVGIGYECEGCRPYSHNIVRVTLNGTSSIYYKLQYTNAHVYDSYRMNDESYLKKKS